MENVFRYKSHATCSTRVLVKLHSMIFVQLISFFFVFFLLCSSFLSCLHRAFPFIIFSRSSFPLFTIMCNLQITLLSFNIKSKCNLYSFHHSIHSIYAWHHLFRLNPLSFFISIPLGNYSFTYHLSFG